MGQAEPQTGLTQGFDAEYDAVRATVLKWSAERRFALMHELGHMIAGSENAPVQRVRTLDKALGLLRTDRPAPSDEEVQSWLDEHKAEKYS